MGPLLPRRYHSKLLGRTNVSLRDVKLINVKGTQAHRAALKAP